MSFPPILETPEVRALLDAGSPVAIGVSGGKDSSACALATVEHLDAVGHTGPRVLIHADLGRVEWRESGPGCERLASRLGLELLTVRRAAGDLMDRWLVRWENNVARYAALSCVKVILPWSTASMRFCTSELKTEIICRALVKRFPEQAIVSASGIRRQESSGRKNAPIAQAQAKLTSKRHGTCGLDWHPIADWKLDEVLAFLLAREVPLHEAYTRYGSTRVSCAFCILGSRADIAASASVPEHADLYREMVALEIASTFSFQAGWLGDVAPHLLSESTRDALAAAKVRAIQREALEAAIPKHLLYRRGWPEVMPTHAEAKLLCGIRRQVAGLLGIEIGYVDPPALLARYAELMREKDERDGSLASLGAA